MRGTKHGFTLIELMVVVAIIGILTAVALPKMWQYPMKAKRTEAVLGLKGIYSAQKDYFVENSEYTDSFDLLGFSIRGGSRISESVIKGDRYTYRLMLVTDYLGRTAGNYRAVAWSTELDSDDFLDVLIIENDIRVGG